MLMVKLPWGESKMRDLYKTSFAGMDAVSNYFAGLPRKPSNYSSPSLFMRTKAPDSVIKYAIAECVWLL